MSTGWSPAVERRQDRVGPAAARALHDLLDAPGPPPGAGDPLPLLWHWLAFLPQAATSALGPDGHPGTGGFLPPAPGRRRMFAGGSVTATGALRVDEVLTRTGTVRQVQDKQGRTGPLRFVTVEHAVTGATGSAQETNDLVYRAPDPAPGPATAQTAAPSTAAPPAPALPAGGTSRRVDLDPVLLFRFAALTYNAHRIHYDRGYACGVEGYPGLVVQGPLQALLLLDLVRRGQPARRPVAVTFRSLAPAFDTDEALELYAVPGPDGVRASARTARGRQTMTATVVLDDPEES